MPFSDSCVAGPKSDSEQQQLQVQLPFDFRMSIAQSVIEQAETGGTRFATRVCGQRRFARAQCGTSVGLPDVSNICYNIVKFYIQYIDINMICIFRYDMHIQI